MPTASELSSTGPVIAWRTILAPTDFSDRSREAVRTAIRIAEKCGAQVTLLHVVQPSAANAFDAGLAVAEIVTSSQECLEELAREMSSGRVKDKLVRLAAQGTVQEIIGTAQDVSADLMVIATHGYGLLKRVLLGSTADYLVRHAPCPVLVVRPKADPGPPRAAANTTIASPPLRGEIPQPPAA